MSAPILVVRLMSCYQHQPHSTLPNEGARTKIEWLFFQDSVMQGGLGQGELGALRQIMQQYSISEQARFVLLLPARDVVLTRVVIPQNQKRQKEKLVPYILEEHLNQNVAEIFFATHWLTRTNDVGVAYIDRAVLNHWLEVLDHQSLKPDVILPEQYLLPYQEGHCFAIFDQGQVLVRQDHWIASAAPLSFAKQWIQNALRDYHHERQLPDDRQIDTSIKVRLLVDAQDEQSLQVSRECEQALSEQAQAVQAGSDESGLKDVRVKVMQISQPVTQILGQEAMRLVTEHHPFQMLQGDYNSARRKRKSKHHWQLAASLVAGLCFVFLAKSTAEYFAFESAYQQTRQDNVALFKAQFPQVKRIRGSLERALSSELAKSANTAEGPGFLNFLMVTGPSLTDANGLVINRLAYDASQSSLKVDLQVADYPDLEKIQKRIEEQALEVEIDGANKDKGKVKARLRIRLS